jgi:hypothetical protein
MEGLCPDLPLLLEAVNNILVAPTNFVREALSLDELSSTWTTLSTHLYCAVFPPWFQSKDPQSLWYYHSLLPIIRGRDTLEEFQALKSGSTAGGLVGHHAPDSTEEDLRRSAMMKRT